MLDGITAVSAFPFLLHMVTACGVLCKLTSHSKDDVISYWTDAALDCYSLAPKDSQLSQYLAYIQAIIATVAFLAHISAKLDVRKIGYGLLFILYVVTQLRHLIWGHGVDVIAYLYTHIVIFSVLVLYNDSLRQKSIKNN